MLRAKASDSGILRSWQETGRRFIGPIGDKKSSPAPTPNFVIVDSKLC